MFCIIILCLEPKWKRQASSNQPPSSPCTWGWDQGSGLAETLAPPYASGKAHKHMIHPPSTAVSMTLIKTFSNRCQNMLTPKWHRLCWKTMEYTHVSAHNVGVEVGQGGGGASREGKQDSSVSSIQSFSSFPFFYTSPHKLNENVKCWVDNQGWVAFLSSWHHQHDCCHVGALGEFPSNT